MNIGCRCLGKVKEDQNAEVGEESIDVVAKEPLEVQTQYVLDAGQPCLVVVGGRSENSVVG